MVMKLINGLNNLKRNNIMENIHLIATNKPSILIFDREENRLLHLQDEPVFMEHQDLVENQNIYITSDEYIGLSYYLDGNLVRKGVVDDKEYWEARKGYKKIILTTDPQLIADGIQAIGEEFLQWFVKNPSCEFVEIVEELKYFNLDELRERHLKGLPHIYSEKIGYKIIIPKEESKKETLEKVAKKQWGNVHRTGVLGFIEGAKWQAEQDKKMYSEEEVIQILINYLHYLTTNDGRTSEEWFEQFKKK
jgi:hypothetical protein